MSRRLLSGALLGILSVLGLGLPAAGSAQQAGTGTITGLVSTDGSMAPIAAAQVHIPEIQIGALTQANGRFLLVNVPAGTHTRFQNRCRKPGW